MLSLTNFTAGNSGRHTCAPGWRWTRCPAPDPDIIVGQLHGAESLLSSSFVMLHYDSGQIRAVMKQSAGGPTSDR